MKDLTSATGLPKSTILFYIAEGLLPKPLHSGRNIAYYDPSSIDRIRLIRHLQCHKRLSLAEIKDYMAKAKSPQDLEAFLTLADTVFSHGEAGPRIFREEFLARSGLDTAQLDGLLAASLLIPVSAEGFDREDLSMAKIFVRAFSWGLEVEDFRYYVELGEQLLDRDFALRQRIVGSLDAREDAVMTSEMTMNARRTRSYIFERMFRRRVAAMKTHHP
jgi:DNA-binding transcriptional MerR regulator